MPDKPLKFRCYQCNQLLGVSRKRAGGVVPCPRCGTELVVPEPSEIDAPTVPVSPSHQPEPSGPGHLESFDFGPEDIRPLIEAARARPRAPEPPLRLDLELEPEPQPEPRPEPEVQLPIELNLEPGPAPEAAEAPRADREEPPGESAGVQVSEPVEPIRPRDWEHRRRDVVLPRTVAVAWSLFVLLALLLAFLAGLLAGHYLWIEPGAGTLMRVQATWVESGRGRE